jgi:hypothetical protein
MSWLKRNLFFLIGSVIALALLGAAGFYFFQKSKLNDQTRAKLKADYDELERLNTQKPHPGTEKIDNIKAAKEQRAQWQELLARGNKFFEPIAPIPEGTNVTDETFAAQLRKTIEQLQREADSASVTLPPRYDFSFGAIKSKITFAPGSLQPLSVQLGEIKAICDILFRAKINNLDSIRRERVSPDDRELADYLDRHSVTNDQVVLTPYEVTFRSFSAELAGVLGGFASSTHGFIVKSIIVEPAGAAALNAPEAVVTYAPTMAPNRPRGEDDEGYRPPTPTVAPVAPGVRGGLTPVLVERPVRVTLWLELVKLNRTTP